MLSSNVDRMCLKWWTVNCTAIELAYAMPYQVRGYTVALPDKYSLFLRDFTSSGVLALIPITPELCYNELSPATIHHSLMKYEYEIRFVKIYWRWNISQDSIERFVTIFYCEQCINQITEIISFNYHRKNYYTPTMVGSIFDSTFLRSFFNFYYN